MKKLFQKELGSLNEVYDFLKTFINKYEVNKTVQYHIQLAVLPLHSGCCHPVIVTAPLIAFTLQDSAATTEMAQPQAAPADLLDAVRPSKCIDTHLDAHSRHP